MSDETNCAWGVSTLCRIRCHLHDIPLLYDLTRYTRAAFCDAMADEAENILLVAFHSSSERRSKTQSIMDAASPRQLRSNVSIVPEQISPIEPVSCRRTPHFLHRSTLLMLERPVSAEFRDRSLL